jgi:hypothetical protein
VVDRELLGNHAAHGDAHDVDGTETGESNEFGAVTGHVGE